MFTPADVLEPYFVNYSRGNANPYINEVVNEYTTNVCKNCFIKKIPKLIHKYTFTEKKLRELITISRLVLYRTKLNQDPIQLIINYLIEPIVNKEYRYELEDIKYDR